MMREREVESGDGFDLTRLQPGYSSYAERSLNDGDR